jgi:hypothetical protein
MSDTSDPTSLHDLMLKERSLPTHMLVHTAAGLFFGEVAAEQAGYGIVINYPVSVIMTVDKRTQMTSANLQPFPFAVKRVFFENPSFQCGNDDFEPKQGKAFLSEYTRITTELRSSIIIPRNIA